MLQRHDHLPQQMHQDGAKLVEALYRGWLETIVESLEGVAIEALLFYQALTSYETQETVGVVESLVRSFSISNADRTASPEAFVYQLDKLLQASQHLPAEVHHQLWGHLLEHLAARCFNRLMGRGRPPLTWRRAIQIQYNLSMLSEWLTRHGLSTAIWDPLAEAVKLLQLAKTLQPGDTALLAQACPHLSTAQQACLLAAYEPDEYEDGPVSPLLLHELPKGESPFMQVRPISLLPLQVAFRAPVHRPQAPVSPMMPPRVWRLMVTYRSFT